MIYQIMGNKSLKCGNAFNNELESIYKNKKRQMSANSSNNSEPLIFKAIDDNDCEAIRQLVKSGYNLNKVDINGLTPLHCAAINGSEECVQLLISLGSQLRCCSLRLTALHFAAQNGSQNIINMLIDYDCGQSLDAKDLMGDTPLASAVQVNNVETAVALLKRGAVLESGVVMSAVELGFTHMLRHLLNQKPNMISAINLSEFKFTRVAVLSLTMIYYSGFKFSDSFRNESQPLDWLDFCLSGQLSLPPTHYNREKDTQAFHVFSLWLEEQQRQPLSLKCQSRIAFRKACEDQSIDSVLTHLKLPLIINDYLLLKDIK